MQLSRYLCPFLAVVVAAGLLTKPNPSTLIAASTPHTSGPGAPIRCATSAQLLAALAFARKTDNVVIELQPVEYDFNSQLVVQGNGTTIHGNGATIVTTAIFTGLVDPLTNCNTQGTAIVVEPLLGANVKFSKQTNGLWRNPRRTCTALNVAAGGSRQEFYEFAPCQDAVAPALSTYTLFAPYIVPANNITIQDLNIRFANPNSDSAVYVTYSKNVTIKNVHVDNTPAELNGGTAWYGDLWAVGSQNVTFDSCSGPVYVEMNSSTSCTVMNCDLGGVTFEEMCRKCLVTNNDFMTCRVNDILCSDITFTGNTFAQSGLSVGNIWGGTRIVFKNNAAAGECGFGVETRGCTMTGNAGPSFVNCGTKTAGDVVTANIITK